MALRHPPFARGVRRRSTARCCWLLLAGLTSAGACRYPEFDFVQNGSGGAGSAGAGGSGAGFGGGGTAGVAGGANASGTAGTSGTAGSVAGGGTGAGGQPGGAGGAAGASGEGGAGGSVVPARCTDYAFLPDNCICQEYEEHAYFFCRTYRSFWIANINCGYDGMKLVRIDDSQENGWVRATAAAQAQPIEFFWIGATSEDGPGVASGTWRWVDGDEFWEGDANGTLTGDYAGWRQDSPTDPATGPDEPCAYNTVSGWDDTYCTDTRMYVCEWY